MTTRRVSLLVAALSTAALGACSGDDDPDATELGDGAVGWCLDFDLEEDPLENSEVTKLPRVDCEDEHTHEVFAVFESTDPDDPDKVASVYPGFDALEVEAQVKCLDRFEEYVGISPFDSTLFYSWMVPSLTSWSDPDIKNSDPSPGNPGDREIICVVGMPGNQSVAAGDLLFQSNL